MDRGLNHGLNKSHSCDDTAHRDKLINEVGLETARGHMVTPKIALKVDVVALGFSWEGFIVGLSCLLL